MLLMFVAAAAVASQISADEATVRDVESRWSSAFVSGDSAYLDKILASDYVSVGADGTAHSKATVIAAATRYATANPGQKASLLPPTSTIQIENGVALVRHFSPTETSVDVLQKRNGEWLAWFSQHTAVKGEK